VSVPIAQHFVLMYARDVAAARTLDDDEVRLIDPSAAFIDIGDDVRDYALLNIPMRRICGEDAEGRPLCGKPVPAETLDYAMESAHDPRWDKLRGLTTE